MYSTRYYPAAPENAYFPKPSAAFKKEVTKVAGAILLFFLVYLLLLIAAGALAVGCFFLSIKIITNLSGTYSILASLGVLAVGVSVIVFLIKFVFSKTKHEDESRIEIKASTQPELFAFIRQLSKDSGAPFPKKIFVSPAVNAAVFYNSSFWSMFFPVKKNLEIGLGLVNTVNLSEFKAVMAHEFGHFSQKSMKLGSFTYNVNHVIYNMLYENKGYQKFLGTWGSLHGILSLFAYVTIGIAQGIQSILKGMYQLINKQYYGLSRQMEFNADAVAAMVAGSNNLITALNRLELSENSYNAALQKADDLLKEKLVSDNIFNNQRSIMSATATELQLTQQDGLPQVTRQFLDSFSRSRINYKNQWASHPTNEERETELLQLNMPAVADTRSAWVLFSDPEALQQSMTQHLYRNVKDAGGMQQYNQQLFEQKYAEETEKYQLPKVFRQYYNRRYIDVQDWLLDDMAQNETSDDKVIQQVLNGTYASLPERIRNNEKDLEIIQAIKDKRIDVKSFDFDGEKYDVESAAAVISKLEEEIKEETNQLATLDKQLYAAFYHRAFKESSGEAAILQQLYAKYQHMYRLTNAFADIASKIVATITPFYQGTVKIELVQSAVQALRDNYEIVLKARLRELLADYNIETQLPAELKEKMNRFKDKHHYYFMNNEFDNEDLQLLYNICTGVNAELTEMQFAAYKQVLCKQAALLD